MARSHHEFPIRRRSRHRCLPRIARRFISTGREIGRVWIGDIEGYRANLPFTWGAKPHNGLIYFNDVNSGLWIVKLGDKIEKGSMTAPGQ